MMAYFKYNSNNNNGGNWKRAKDGTFNGGSNSRSNHSNNTRKSSFTKGQELSAYQMEERFCAIVGGMSLQEVKKSQRYIKHDDKILQWKDSAAEEAFWNAKTRFWAKLQGEPCDIQLPDPDIFIDKVDWNSIVDPELMNQLERSESDISCATEEHESGVVVGIPSVLLQSELTPTGWGDAEDVKPQQEHNDGVKIEAQVYPTGWDDEYVYVTPDMSRNEDRALGSNNAGRVNESTWSGDWEEQQQYGYEKQWENSYYQQNGWDNGYNQNKDHGGWSTSRYKISRFHHNAGQSPGQHAGRNPTYSRERSLFRWKPVTRQW